MYRWLLVGALVATTLQADEKAKISVKVNKETIDFHDGERLVTTYHYGPSVAKPYLWPLNTPGNVPVTRAWPMKKGEKNETTDHVHQKSAWFCHGDVIPEGVELKVKSSDKKVKGVDFWSESLGHGKIVCVEVGEPKEVPQGASIATKNEWKTPDGITILRENRTLTVSQGNHAYLITVDIEFISDVCPITFGDTKEGALGVRVSDELKVKGGTGTYVNAEGKKNEKAVWGYPSAWNDYSGTIGDKKAGIAVFNDPKNAFPACWHTREYGLMAANPFGRKESGFPGAKADEPLVKMAKGDKLKLRYGLYIHDGDTEGAKIGEIFKRFAK